MLDMDIIENTIRELEASETTFLTCDQLASLYVIRQFHTSRLNDENEPVYDVVEDTVHKELSDILPHYEIYCDKKREYQLGNINQGAVLLSLQEVCREIVEFVHTLYSSTDMPEERHIIEGTLTNIQF